MNIQIQIERLILNDLPVGPGERALVRAAIEAELARLLADGGLAPALRAGGALARVAAPPIQLAPASQPASIGQQIARSVYAGIGERSGE